MISKIPHRSIFSVLCGSLLILASCQATQQEPDSTSKLSLDLPLRSKAYMPDQVTTTIGGKDAASTWTRLNDTSFRLEVTLAKPLGESVLKIRLWSFGMRSFQLECTGACEMNALKIDRDSVALHLLRLMDSLPNQPRTRAGLLDLASSALANADSMLIAVFPDSLPEGISADTIRNLTLIQLQSRATSLASIFDSAKWLPTRDVDSLRSLYLALISDKQLTKDDSTRLFPGAPKPIRLPDQPTTMVAKESGEYLVKWVISGGSAPLVAKIQGEPATADGSIFQRRVPVGYGSNRVTLEVTDRSGLKTFDTITVIRDDGIPSLIRVTPADTTAVPFDSASITLGWSVTDVSGVRSVVIGNKNATKSESVWSARVDLMPGKNEVVVVAEDSLGNIARDTLKLTRKPDTQGPRIEPIEGLGSRLVPYDSASVPVAVNVGDLGGVKSVRIGGIVATGFAGRYQATVPLTVGVNAISVEAVDSTGNASVDTLRPQRHTPMAVSIAGGQYASAAVLQDGSAIVWGGSNLGTSLTPPGSTSLVSIAGGASHFVAQTSAGTVSGWGVNMYDEATPPANLSGIVSVAAGATHSLALKRDGSLVGWGDTTFGSCKAPYGLADIAAIAAGYRFSAALKKDGTVQVWGDSSAKQTTITSGIVDAVSIKAGFGHVVVLLKDGSVKAWGDNTSGQTSVPANLPKAVQIAAGGGHTLALLADSTVVGWGDNGAGQTSAPEGLKGVVAIAAGDGHSLALLHDGSVVAWGEDEYGQVKVPASIAKY